MKILVLGGTGAMGIHLVKIMKEKDHDVFVTSRKVLRSIDNIHYLKGDAKEISFLRLVLQKEKWDAIVDFMVYDSPSFEQRVDILLNNTKQYIYISSARVYAESKGSITEDSYRLLDISQDITYLETDEYALTKARQEDMLKASGQKNWTIIRPYITYSENRLQLGVLEKEEWLYRALHGRSIIFSKDIVEKETTLTYGFDVANGISKLIGESDALGQSYHITTNGSQKWADILSIYLSVLEEHLGYRPQVILQDLDFFLESKNAEYQIRYDRLYNRIFDSSKISGYLESESFVEPEIGLRNCLKIFLQNPQFSDINWREEAIKDRQANEFTPLREIIGIKSKIKYLLIRYGLMK